MISRLAGMILRLVGMISYLVGMISHLAGMILHLAGMILRLAEMILRLAEMILRLAEMISHLAGMISHLAGMISRLAGMISRLAGMILPSRKTTRFSASFREMSRKMRQQDVNYQRKSRNRQLSCDRGDFLQYAASEGRYLGKGEDRSKGWTRKGAACFQPPTSSREAEIFPACHREEIQRFAVSNTAAGNTPLLFAHSELPIA
jgi:hypothetical protein